MFGIQKVECIPILNGLWFLNGGVGKMVAIQKKWPPFCSNVEWLVWILNNFVFQMVWTIAKATAMPDHSKNEFEIVILKI